MVNDKLNSILRSLKANQPGFHTLNLSNMIIPISVFKEITTLLDGQWKDGMVPHILFHDTNTNSNQKVSSD